MGYGEGFDEEHCQSVVILVGLMHTSYSGTERDDVTGVAVAKVEVAIDGRVYHHVGNGATCGTAVSGDIHAGSRYAIGHSSAPCGSAIGEGLPAIPLREGIESIAVWHEGRHLLGDDESGSVAPLRRVAHSADAAHIIVVGGGRRKASDGEGIDVGRLADACADGGSVGHVLDLPGGDCWVVSPSDGGRGGGEAGHREAVWPWAGGDGFYCQAVDIDTVVHCPAGGGREQGDVSAPAHRGSQRHLVY